MIAFQHRVRDAFDQAGTAYDRYSVLQRHAFLELLPLLPESVDESSCWLDVGSGTGLVSEVLSSLRPGVQVISFDLAAGMLGLAAEKGSRLLVQGDMHQLPFQSESLSVVLSNFALQWTDQPAMVLAELVRVLRGDGLMAISVPVRGSLQALSRGWESAGLRSPVNALPPQAAWLEAAHRHGLQIVEQRNARLRHADDDPRQALALLRDLGAGAQKKPATGLMGVRRWQKALAGWSLASGGQGYCIDYDVLWLVLVKKTS